MPSSSAVTSFTQCSQACPKESASVPIQTVINCQNNCSITFLGLDLSRAVAGLPGNESLSNNTMNSSAPENIRWSKVSTIVMVVPLAAVFS